MSDFREDGAAALEWVARYLEGVGDRRVAASVAPGDVRARLPSSPPDQGEAFAEVLQDLEEVVLPGITHWNHPRFLGYFATSGSDPGILAELLVAALNVNAMLWTTSPAATEIEELAVDWLRQLLGLPEGLHGHIEETASAGTIIAVAAARGLRPGGAVLASEQANFSVEKAARLVGLEYRTVAVDAEFRMRPDALADELARGPVTAVVPTVGTTSTTSVDPVADIVELCAPQGIWVHVDAAYAGSAAVCDEHRWALAGAERAQSIVVNPHKWLFTPLDCSVFWTREPAAVHQAFSSTPEYMPPPGQETNLKDYSPALGRRFRGLKLWTVLRCFGKDGLQEKIREHVRLARLFASWIEAEPGWEVVAPYPFAVVCFRRAGSDEENELLVRRVNDGGEIFISGTRLAGRYVLRLAVGNVRTTEADVLRAWDVLREAA